MIRPFLVCGLLLADVGNVHAQARDSSTVPRALAEALLQYAGSGDFVTISAAKLPDARFTPMVPAAARVLGGAVHSIGGAGGRSTVAILRFEVDADSARNLIKTALTNNHWRPAPDPRTGMGGGGFTATIGSVGSLNRGLNYCSDSLSMWGMAYKDRTGGAIAELSIQNAENTQCSPDFMERMTSMRGRFDTPDLPELTPPEGTRVTSEGSGGSGTSTETTAVLETSLDAAAIIAHFRPQLERQGWTLGKLVGDGEISVQIATRKNEKGKTLYLTVADRVLFAGSHESTLRVTVESRQR